ncbi:LysM peptidoglycan-binding domain-containing protein [Pengzhenrongella frigida]|uniref:LysM peptidoglycan-binding domain-containing protein n=1 Tax=Pengzhenrongella frigida TaxID=1259133 RepID=A0A4Q5N4X8_9MICO|nr:LysM peptidoglycan-binding domain-containing protein [Cellulomonas sp. HLT2-17]RYV52463.1 LysM peptidoglycan-binding domain-containing protein [Cellulomonas sp. HLT2-17]
MSTALSYPTGFAAGDSLTLTTRGRRVLGAVAIVLASAVVLIGGRAVASAPTEAVAVDTYTVAAGESLWAIAADFTAPHEDVRDTVGDLVALNGLAGAGLRAGQQILVPAS